MKYTLGLKVGGLMEDPGWRIERVRTVEAESLDEAKDAWAVATGEFRSPDWDPKTRTSWGFRVVPVAKCDCLGGWKVLPEEVPAPRMREAEYDLRREVYRLAKRLYDYDLDELQVTRLARELIDLSGVCPKCDGDYVQGDPPDAAGVGGGTYLCDCNGGMKP